jgi:hypothetical protein
MNVDDDLPVLVYTGGHDDSLFLASLLEGSGIPATFVQSRHFGLPHSVLIPRRDMALAKPLIDDFIAGGSGQA